MDYTVDKNKLLIGDNELTEFEVIKEIGRGANGVVFLVNNLALGRTEALKIWQNQKDKDSRDKIKQGLLESRKLAKVDGNYAVKIFTAKQINDLLVATMEYFEGETLRDFILDKNQIQICQVLRLYLHAIEETSIPETFHGDAHDKNVLIRIKEIKYEKELELKLCDFGTSIFSGKENSFQRHWRIVRETVCKCTKTMKGYKEAQEMLKEFEQRILKTQNEMTKEIKSGQIKYYDSRIFTAAYKDYLEYLEFTSKKV